MLVAHIEDLPIFYLKKGCKNEKWVIICTIVQFKLKFQGLHGMHLKSILINDASSCKMPHKTCSSAGYYAGPGYPAVSQNLGNYTARSPYDAQTTPLQTAHLN